MFVFNGFRLQMNLVTLRRYSLASLAAILLAGSHTGARAGTPRPPAPSAVALEALHSIRSGDPQLAAATLRRALARSPESPALNAAAAALLTWTGDAARAASVWEWLLSRDPADPLALYGLGICELARRKFDRAEELLQQASRIGDQGICLLALQYASRLRASRGGDGSVPLPDSLKASARALAAYSAARSGQAETALEASAQALYELPGDPFAEPPGILMGCDPARPLRFGAERLPLGHSLAPPKAAGSAPLAGIVLLGPEPIPAKDIGFVAYRIDDSLAAMVNAPPYRFSWNTARASNGSHKVEIVVYDRSGDQIARAERQIRTWNASVAARDSGEGPEAEPLRASLWNLMALRPSRYALARLAALAAKEQGKTTVAIRMAELAAAVDPEPAEAHATLASLSEIRAAPSLWRFPIQEKWIALTFDDGPKPGVTEELLAILSREKVPATFFVIGRHTTQHPDLARKIAEAGMQIENHSYSHANLAALSPAGIARELLRTQASVFRATGIRMRYFRPPGGNTSHLVNSVAAKWGLTPCMWTADAEAYEQGSPERLVDFALSKAKPGGILLLHNGRRTTVDALPLLIRGLRQMGYRFATINQLAAMTGGGPSGSEQASARTLAVER